MAGLRLPGLPDPSRALRRFGSYVWRDPDEEMNAYSGMGLGSYLGDTLRSMNPITQAQDIWDYKLGFGEAPPGDPVMAYPIGPGRFAPRTKGVRAETLQKGDEWVDYTGDVDRFKAPREPDGETLEAMQGWQSSARRGYNLRNEKNEIIASADAIRGLPGDRNKYVPSIWVRPDYRRTPAFNDLQRLITRDGKFGIRGEAVNPRLIEIQRRRTDPERLKLLKAVSKIPDRSRVQAHNVRRGLAEHTQWGRPKPTHQRMAPVRRTPAQIPDRPVSTPARPREVYHDPKKNITYYGDAARSKKRDTEAERQTREEVARMERNLGINRFNARRRGGV